MARKPLFKNPFKKTVLFDGDKVERAMIVLEEKDDISVIRECFDVGLEKLEKRKRARDKAREKARDKARE